SGSFALHDQAAGCPAASHFLLLRQKKVTKEKATLLSASFLRYRFGRKPAVLGPDGVKNNSPSAQTSFCLIRLDLRSSAHTERAGDEIRRRTHEMHGLL
ncbi:MAG: hypothetical protein Q7T70_00500, partial [Polaromonas sp.]|nr:hypothetical protein [Polaromonas sp.]